MNHLKEAEKKANELVQNARKMRADRMKDAKLEAEQSINTYKADLEAKYQAAFAKQSGSSGLAGNELNASTASDIANLSKDFNNKKGAVEKMLFDAVLNVKVTAPVARGM